ncbi:MAG: TetR/AcrR family transcriptional regulator [Halioglobus sp.]
MPNPAASPGDAPEHGNRGRSQASDGATTDMRDRIINASAAVYAEHGYHGSSVERILQAAGISRPTFYRYFSDRYDAIDAVISDVNTQLLHSILQAINQATSLDDLLEAAVDAYFDWGRNHGPLVGSIYREIHDAASPASERRSQVQASLRDAFAQAGRGAPAVVDEPLLYEAAIHLVEHLGHATFWPAPVAEAERLHRRRIILRALRAMFSEQG